MGKSGTNSVKNLADGPGSMVVRKRLMSAVAVQVLLAVPAMDGVAVDQLMKFPGRIECNPQNAEEASLGLQCHSLAAGVEQAGEHDGANTQCKTQRPTLQSVT